MTRRVVVSACSHGWSYLQVLTTSLQTSSSPHPGGGQSACSHGWSNLQVFTASLQRVLLLRTGWKCDHLQPRVLIPAGMDCFPAGVLLPLCHLGWTL